MTISIFILRLLQAICTILVDSMKIYEKVGDCDADGIPVSSEYDRQAFLLASLRDTCKEIENYNTENYEKE